MKALQLEIPKEILLCLKIPEHLIQDKLKEELAIHLYREGYLSFGKARQLASLSKWEFAELIGKRKIPRHYTDESLEEDLQFAYGK